MINDNEIRLRKTSKQTYYVIGDEVRTDLLDITTALRKTIQPLNFNGYDADALYKMSEWLEEDRDFTEMQWIKFGKMLKKFGLPNNIKTLAKRLNWKFGKPLTREEMWAVMEKRRNTAAFKETREHMKQKFISNATVMFDELFEIKK